MKNSDKIKKFLDYGCHVEVKQATFLTGEIIVSVCEDDEGLVFISNTGKQFQEEYLHKKGLIITPIYFKPPYKVGDKVDVNPEWSIKERLTNNNGLTVLVKK